MDASQIFNTLRTGTKFDFKRFERDALLIGLPLKTPSSNPSNNDNSLDLCTKIVVNGNPPKNRLTAHKVPKKHSKSLPDDTSEISVLGKMKSTSNISLECTNKKKMVDKSQKTKHQQQIAHIRKTHRIHVYGNDVPDPVTTFSDLQSHYHIHTQIVDNISHVGYQSPTPIQMQTIPVMIEKRDLMACAPTGSGKTAAFILPILHHLVEPRNVGFRALVLSPTRELAKQTYLWFQRLSEGLNFRIFHIEKVASAKKISGSKAAKKCDILVSTPQRLIYLIRHDPPLIDLSNLHWLIVDECDKLFEEGKDGFRDQIAEIYNACDNNNIRRAMFSATFAFDVEQWCKANLDNVVQVYIGGRNTAVSSVHQELIYVGSEEGKMIAMRDLIDKGLEPPVLVFVQSRQRAKELFKELLYDGINVDVIHADRTQKERDNTIRSLRNGAIWVLICTELMGRGIDFYGIKLVINFDFPTSAISYIHRIGRTGRANQEGRAVTFFTDDDAVYLRNIANVMREAGCPVPEYMVQIKKQKAREKRKLAKRVPVRPTISTVPQCDIQAAAKKRKLENFRELHKSRKRRRSCIQSTQS